MTEKQANRIRLNYKKGVAKEGYHVRRLRKEGFDIAQRSAGSHSPVDLFAINKVTRVIKFIQCKPLSMSENKKKEIELDLRWLNNMFRVEFEVI